jgi:hypothetical protein
MIHSLGSIDYLKIEEDQHLFYACQYYDDRQVCVQEQFNIHNKDQGDRTDFTDIYRLKVHEITLRELMLVQSLYASKTASDVSHLVALQPAPTLFFKVFLELGMKSMVPYLSFDSRSVKSILSPEHDEYFRNNNFDRFPVFYKNQDGRSAIDVAAENNQIRSVNSMINYIIVYQNSFVYAHLFEHNLVELIEKEVEITPLLDSEVLNYTFDFDQWPSTSPNISKL